MYKISKKYISHDRHFVFVRIVYLHSESQTYFRCWISKRCWISENLSKSPVNNEKVTLYLLYSFDRICVQLVMSVLHRICVQLVMSVLHRICVQLVMSVLRRICVQLVMSVLRRICVQLVMSVLRRIIQLDDFLFRGPSAKLLMGTAGVGWKLTFNAAVQYEK